MTTWESMKPKLNSIRGDEMSAIEKLAILHSTRIKRGISQTELADRMGISKFQLAKIENPTSIPKPDILKKYEKSLE